MSVPATLDGPFLLVKPCVDETEFYASADEDSPWELIDGRLVMSPASNVHGDIFRFLMTILSTWLDERGGGVVRGSRYPMRLDPRWSPEPDILVVLDEHLERLGPQRLEGPADLVVEIASEGDPGFDTREKLPRYREAGIQEIWLIDPMESRMRIETIDDEGRYQSRILSSGRLESKVVPGFWIELDWLWQRPLPSTWGCLQELIGTD